MMKIKHINNTPKNFNLFKDVKTIDKFKFYTESQYLKAVRLNAKLCFFGKNDSNIAKSHYISKTASEFGFKLIRIGANIFALCMDNEDYLKFLKESNNELKYSIKEKKEKKLSEEEEIFIKQEKEIKIRKEERLQKPWKDPESLFCDGNFLKKPVDEGGLGIEIRKCDEL